MSKVKLYENTPWPCPGGNLFGQKIAKGNNFPTSCEPNVTVKRLEGTLLTAGAMVSFPTGGRSDYFTLTTTPHERLRNHLQKVSWNPDETDPEKRLTITSHYKEFNGFLIVVDDDGKPKLIGANYEKGRLEQIDPKTELAENEDPEHFSPVAFKGEIVSGMTLLAENNPPLVVIATSKNLLAFNYENYENEMPFRIAEPMVARMAAYEGKKLIYSMPNPVDGKGGFRGGKLVRKVFVVKHGRTKLVPDPEGGLNELHYNGLASGSTPTIVGDRVFFTNNEAPNPRPGEENEYTVFSVNANDFSDCKTATPFARGEIKSDSVVPATWSGSSLYGYEGDGSDDDPSYVIALSWAAGLERNPTIGVAKVNILADGSLETDWRDPVPSLKRYGCLAPESNMVVYSYHVGNQHRLRAVKLKGPMKIPGRPDEIWDIPLQDEEFVSDGSAYMGITVPGDGDCFLVSNLDGVYVIW